jgi:hypothetical protein
VFWFFFSKNNHLLSGPAPKPRQSRRSQDQAGWYKLINIYADAGISLAEYRALLGNPDFISPDELRQLSRIAGDFANASVFAIRC